MLCLEKTLLPLLTYAHIGRPLLFDAPPSEFLNSIPYLTNAAKTLLWYGLAPDTRRGYGTAIRSYEFFCTSRGTSAWPATTVNLIAWANTRAFGSAIPNQGQIQPDTISGYLSGLCSYHVDRNFSTTVFESLQLDRVLRGVRRMFPRTEKTRLPITKDILQKITRQKPTSLQELNINTTFKVAWACFLRMGEFTYTKAELANRKIFSATKLTRSDITFSQNDQYVVLRLKRSKTDVKHTGVEIIIAATNDLTCPVLALQELFMLDPKPSNAPLFSLDSGTTFARNQVIQILRQRLQDNGIPHQSCSGHSFRKGAAQHASDNGMLDEHIQKLGRWSSQTFQLYFKTSSASLYSLNLRFQTGRPPAVNIFPTPTIKVCLSQTLIPSPIPPTPLHLGTVFYGRSSDVHFLPARGSLSSPRR